MEDRGPGVPDHDIEGIFDKFYQVSVPEGRGGTGLGLSICKGIVEAHGGRIKAENRSGKGLVVQLPLPLKVMSTKKAYMTNTTDEKTNDSESWSWMMKPPFSDSWKLF